MDDTSDPSPSEPSGARSQERARRRAEAASPQARQRRRRRRRLLFSGVLVTFVLVFGWIGVIVLLQMLPGGGETSFREETRAILEALRDGEGAQIYDRAAPGFRERTTRERFLEVVADIEANLGSYQEILNIQVAERIDGPGGRTARVHCTIAFDRGRVAGRFSFHESPGGSWRLLGLGFGMPEVVGRADGIAAGPDPPAAEPPPPAPLPAPDAVLEQVDRIMAQTREGDFGDIYDLAAEPLKAGLERSRFEAILAGRQAALGRFVEVVEVVEAVQNPARDRARVSLQAAFARAETRITLRFLRGDDGWRLTMYKVAMPGPSIPAVSTAGGF